MKYRLTTSNCQTLTHPMNCWKDDWVLSRKSIHAEGLIVDHHIEPPDEVVEKATMHHILCYFFNFGSRQITRMNGEEYDGAMKQGSLWLKPTYMSGFWHWESTDECLMFAIKPDFLRKVALENDCLNPDKIEVMPIVHTRNSELDILAMQFKQEIDNPKFGNRMYIESLANIFAIQLLRDYCTFPATLKEIKGGLSPFQKQQAIDFIQTHLTQDVGLKKISELTNLSQFHFVRQFKKSIGITPHQYIMQQRVEMAKRLLKQQDLAIANIALDCGFSNQSHLGRVFKRHIGTTPKKYREEVN